MSIGKGLLVTMLFLMPLWAISVQEKKKNFIERVLPIIQKVHRANTLRYESSMKASADTKLLKALKPPPVSITLAQAAIESGWGTSRFFRKANNIFGVWAYGKNMPRIAAKKKRKGKTIWIKKYDSLEASIKDYYLNIGRSFAFKKFRSLNLKTQNPYKLVKELKMYSEKRALYSKELAQIIRFNNFTKYDSHSAKASQ